MSLKVKLISAITLFMLMLGVLIIGVLAASSQTLTMTGSVQFNVGDRSLYVKDVKIQHDMSGTLYDVDNFMPGYINGNFDMNIGEFTTENGSANQHGSFRIYFYIINTSENTYNAVEEVELSETLVDQGVTVTASGEISPTTITEEDSNGNKVIDATTEHNGIIELTVIALDASTIDLNGVLITIQDVVYEGFTFTTQGSTATLSGYNGTEIDVIIPSTFSIRESDRAYIPGEAYTVTAIADNTAGTNGVFFQTRGSIKSVSIPETITSIGGYAFYSCYNLTSITIPIDVNYIGDNAFEYCYGLVEVYNYSSNFTIIKDNNSATNAGYLGQYAKVVYNSTDLADVVKPETRITTELGDGNVQYYVYGSDVIALAPVGARNSTTSVELLSTTTEIGQTAFSWTYIESILIPKNVTIIGDHSFRNTSLTSITFENDSQLKSIGVATFYGSNLNNVVLPDNVTNIGEAAFDHCSNLANITFSSNLEQIGNYAFQSCTNLTNITIPSSVTSIGRYAFSGAGITNVTFNNPTGWGYSSSLTGSTSPIDSAELENSSTAASLLKNDYLNYYWIRSEINFQATINNNSPYTLYIETNSRQSIIVNQGESSVVSCSYLLIGLQQITTTTNSMIKTSGIGKKEFYAPDMTYNLVINGVLVAWIESYVASLPLSWGNINNNMVTEIDTFTLKYVLSGDCTINCN